MRLTKEQVAAEVKKVMDGDFYCFYVSPKRTKRFVSLIGSNEHGDIERVVTTIYNMLKVIYTNEDKASSLFPLYYYVDMDISKIFPVSYLKNLPFDKVSYGLFNENENAFILSKQSGGFRGEDYETDYYICWHGVVTHYYVNDDVRLWYTSFKGEEKCHAMELILRGIDTRYGVRVVN